MIVVLIGPMEAGKSTIARLLAARLGLPRFPLDKHRWAYFAEIGYDEEHAARLAEREGLESASRYWKPFEVHAVERHLAESRDCIVDFGAGYSVQDDPVLHERVKRALAPHPNVVLLLPCADVEEAISSLDERVAEDLRGLNEHYVRHPANRELAKTFVYTNGRTPTETCDDVLGTLGIKPSTLASR